MSGPPHRSKKPLRIHLSTAEAVAMDLHLGEIVVACDREMVVVQLSIFGGCTLVLRKRATPSGA